MISRTEKRVDKGEIDLYYFDASGFSLDPVIPYAWQKIGQQISIPAQR